MDIARLQLLRELADRGSITAVAEATHRTPSAVSQQLKLLEREAGVPLTEPAGRGIALTSAGKELARTAEELAVAIERAEASWKEFRQQPTGVVTLTIFPTAGQMLLPGVLAAVERMPQLSLVCTDQDLHRGDFADLTPDFDIVVADSPNVLPVWTERRLTVVQLMTEPLDVALPIGHPLASKASLAAADLIDETWIGIPGVSPYGRVLRHIEAVNGSPARVSQRFLDNGIVESVVAAGHGIAILPRYTTRDHDNGLVTRPLRDIRASRLISVLMRPDRAERPSVRAVVRALQDETAKFRREHSD